MFLRTERLFLRPAWLEDAPELTRAIGQEPVVRMLARVPWPYREEHARAWIQTPKDPHLPNVLVTLPEENGRIVGCTGLHDDEGRVAVGYWIEPGYWGRGYATEALNGVLLAVRPWHAREVSHDHLVADRAGQIGGILEPSGPQEQPVGANEHVTYSLVSPAP